MTDGIKVKNLQSVSSISGNANFLVLTDNTNNSVNLITKKNLASTLPSTTANNLLTSDDNGLLVNNFIGELTNLDTTNKTSIVSAINENVTNINTNKTNIGTLTNLDTTNKTNLVSAINENNTSIGVLNPLVFLPVNTLATSGTINLQDNSANQITPTGNVTFVLPAVNDTNTHQIEVNIKLTSTKTINFGTTYYYNYTAPDLSTIGNYELIYTYDHLMSKWRCGCIAVGEV